MRKERVLPTKPLGEVLDELIDALGIRSKLREQGVFSMWDGAVGERIAQIAQPTRIVRGTLFVSVKSGVWRNELNMRKQEIVRRLNETLAEEIVKDIKFQ